MQIINEKSLDAVKLVGCERFFVELWYSLTHIRSLDSFRVRCLNSRLIIKEVLHEIEVGRAPGDELGQLVAEAESTLSCDPVVSSSFAQPWSRLRALLEDKKKQWNRDEFRYAIEDIHEALQNTYFDRLCEQLPLAIQDNDHIRTNHLTNSLATDLLDRGWSLETLYGWHGHFLKKSSHSFRNNLAFMLHQFQRTGQPFRVILRVSGSTRTQSLHQQSHFAISDKADLQPNGRKEQSFCSPNPNLCFAECEVTANYHDDAAITARTQFENLLDLLRFEYERAAVHIDEESLVERKGDSRRQIVRLRAQVPNPVESLQEGDFLEFARRFDAVSQNEGIEKSSRRLIHTAIRQYRFGRDSTSYKDKFINWWMGLEAVCKTSGDIGKTVARRTSHCTLHGYLFRLARDFLTTIKYCQISWSANLASQAGCQTLEDLSVGQLVSVVQSATHQPELLTSLASHPHVEQFGRQLCSWLTSPEDCLRQLSEHLDRLRWHLARLFRVRCCIVHGSPLIFKLPLLTANLEYYLKCMIVFTMNALHEHRQVNALSDVFARTQIANELNMKRLGANGADAATIRDVVFAGLIAK